MITWCVAHTHPSKELIAKQHLLEQEFEVYLPQFKKIRKHARKVEEVFAPLFPRYIFVGLNLKNAPWRCINSTRGISYLLMSNTFIPDHVSAQVIEKIKRQEVSEGIVPVASLVTFIKGEKLRILDGAFQEQIADFDVFDEKTVFNYF